MDRGAVGFAAGEGPQRVEAATGADGCDGGAGVGEQELKGGVVAAGEAEHAVGFEQAGCRDCRAGGDAGSAAVGDGDDAGVGEVAVGAHDGRRGRAELGSESVAITPASLTVTTGRNCPMWKGVFDVVHRFPAFGDVLHDPVVEHAGVLGAVHVDPCVAGAGGETSGVGQEDIAGADEEAERPEAAPGSAPRGWRAGCRSLSLMAVHCTRRT
ncbi:hypothetical protein AB0K15_42930 [Amycolatopsis sp. NPDC049253]|uniref:hypothetical protein n=1 Tax=Amycolatopsis sp. NPDC049253 TaxID=3155274 RepID=UPI00341B5202